tara:strand:- start:6682 stop:6834 length:153 start_codon:yes stop_codon:yes gene_type:complete
MPIWLRKFTFNKIQEHFDKVSKANSKPEPTHKKPLGPGIKPSFIAKASKN